MSKLEGAVPEVAELFRTALAEAWTARRSQEEAIARAYAPVIDQISHLLASIAGSVAQVTGEQTKVTEPKRVFHVSTQSLVTHQCILHPGGEFHVRLHYGPTGIEYHKERTDLSAMDALLQRLAHDALTHFGPKPS